MKTKNKYYLKYIWTLLSPYKYKYLLLSFLMILSAGGNMVIPFIQQRIIDDGIISENRQKLLYLICIAVSIYFLISFLSYMIYKIQNEINYSFSQSLQIKSMKHLIRLKKEHLDGEGVLKLSKDADYCVSSLNQITNNSVSQMLIETFKFFGILVAIFVINWKMALLMLSFIPFRLLINIFIGLKSSKYSQKNITLHQEMHKLEEDIYSTTTEIKLWNLYDKEDKKYAEIINPINKVLKKINLIHAFDNQLGEGIGQLIHCLIYLFAALMIWGKTLSIGGLFVILSYFYYILTPIALFASLNLIFSNLKPAIDKFDKYMNMEEEKLYETSKTNSSAYNIISPNISLNEVSFSYGERKILNNITFQINFGEKIALIGDNGSGKSTLIEILLKLKEPTSGSIFLNNCNINDFPLNDYRYIFGVVTQFPNLFDSTIADNISLFNTFDIDKKTLNSPLFRFIDNFPNYINNQVGSKSTMLSGGEKQKIALLRVLMKKSPIMILDEPTSNYDKESREEFIEMMRNLECSAIIVSHDYEILKIVDKIVLLDAGKSFVYKDFETYSNSPHFISYDTLNDK